MVIFNERLADVAERFLRKGRKVYLEGALETRKYTDQSGQEKYTTEVVLRNFRGELVLLDSNRGEEGGYGGAAEGGSTPGGSGYAPRERAASGPARPSGGASGRAGGPSWDAPKGGDLDDEIPF